MSAIPPPPIIQLVDLGKLQRFSHDAMATQFRLHLRATDAATALRPIAEEAFRLLDRLEERLSFYQEGSDVTRINRAAAGDTVRIDDITHRCLLDALEVSAATAGAFDPFAGHAALIAKGQPVPHHLSDIPSPAPNDDAPVLAIDPEQPVVTKLAGQRWLDLGAVGKGAVLDAMAELLKEWDITTAVLNGGGSSLMVFGPPPDPTETTWELRLPQSTGEPTLRLAAPFALGASGEGFQPGHIIDRRARTSRPQCLVLAPRAALADALSTAAILLTDEEIRALVGEDPRFGVFATHAERSAVSAGVFQTELTRAGPEVTLVIPCWCESKRLPPFLTALAKALEERQLPVEIIVVDDGSPRAECDRTRRAVETVRASFTCIRPLFAADRHQGKGGAIYQGWHAASPLSRWLGFVDADGAVPPAGVISGIERALATTENLPIIAANRYHHDRTLPVKRSWIRQRTGSWFAQWARAHLGLSAVDSQCGFKLVPAHWWRSRTAPWEELGFAFDLELLLAAKADRVATENLNIPWQEIGGSKVGLNDGFALVRSVRRLQGRLDP